MLLALRDSWWLLGVADLVTPTYEGCGMWFAGGVVSPLRCFLLLAHVIFGIVSIGDFSKAYAQSCSGCWSNPSTWPNQQVPTAGANVVVATGQTVILDTHTASLGTLSIQGTLVFDQTKDLNLTAHKIMVSGSGRLQIGTESSPYSRQAVITLTGPRSAITTTTSPEHNALLVSNPTRVLMSHGQVEMWGRVSGPQKTKLVAHAPAGSTTFQVEHPVDWKAGDKIAIAPTDFYGVGGTEILTVAQDTNNSQTIVVTTPLQNARWGRIQYVCNTPVSGNHLSLVPCPQAGAAWIQTTDPATPKHLDMRATLVRLTRNIKITAPNDADWVNQGFGATMMIMNKNTSRTRVSGVEFFRVGQQQLLGQYPFHWHMLSYTSANSQGVGGGAYLGAVAPYSQELMRSSIYQSANRGVVIHGTDGALVYDTYAVDIKGHAFFLEDGVERGNVLLENVALKARSAAQPLKVHERFEPLSAWTQNGASGFWITNPENAVAMNEAADCGGYGLWNAFSTRAFGEARNAPLNPSTAPMGINVGNNLHSNRLAGKNTEFPVFDEAGNTGPHRYSGTGGLIMFNKIWKNGFHGYRNRVGSGLRYQYFTFADNEKRDLTGQSLPGALHEGSLMVGQSLNSATPFQDPVRVGFSGYHGSLDHKNIVAVNYSFTPPVMSPDQQFVYGGGVFDLSDMYDKSIGIATVRNSGWVLRNSHAGYLPPSPSFDGFPMSFMRNGQLLSRNWSLPVNWDPFGYWTQAGRYMIPDRPFYTHGLSDLIDVAPAGQNGKATATTFYGFDDVVFDSNFNNHPEWWGGNAGMALRMARLNNSNAEVDHHLIGASNQSLYFVANRYFSLARGGRYRLTMPSGQMPQSRLRIEIQNAWRSEDEFVVGLPWSGSVTAKGKIDFCTSNQYWYSHAQKVANNHTRDLNISGSSIQSVVADPTGRTIYQDVANNTVYVKVKGGLSLPPWCSFSGDDDFSLAKPNYVTLQPANVSW